MADEAALAQLTAALQRADEQGYERGLAQARAELAGLDPATQVVGAFADALEQTASRYVQVDQAFADRLRVFADRLRHLNDPPAVSAFDPREGAQVPASIDIVQATFDRDMDAGSVSLSVQAASGGAALKGEASYDRPSRTVSLRLENGLTAGVTYRATVDGKSVDGVPLGDAFTWEFSAVK